MTLLLLLLSLTSRTLSSLFYYHCLTYILFSILGSDGKDAESDVVQETDEDEDDQVRGCGHGKNTKVPTKNKAIEVHDSDSEDM